MRAGPMCCPAWSTARPMRAAIAASGHRIDHPLGGGGRRHHACRHALQSPVPGHQRHPAAGEGRRHRASYAHADVALYGIGHAGPGDGRACVPLIEGGVVAFKISGFECSPTRFPRIPAGPCSTCSERSRRPTSRSASTTRTRKSSSPGSPRRARRGKRHRGAFGQPAPGRRAGLHRAFPRARRAYRGPRPPGASHVGAGVSAGRALSCRGFSGHRRTCASTISGSTRRCTGSTGRPDEGQPADPAGPDRGALGQVGAPAVWRSSAPTIRAGRSTTSSPPRSSMPVPVSPASRRCCPPFSPARRRREFDAPRLTAEYTRQRPAKFFGLWPRKGGILPGADADLAVFSPGPAVWDARQGAR